MISDPGASTASLGRVLLLIGIACTIMSAWFNELRDPADTVLGIALGYQSGKYYTKSQ